MIAHKSGATRCKIKRLDGSVPTGVGITALRRFIGDNRKCMLTQPLAHIVPSIPAWV
jgi:hypothetical protein